MLGVQGWLEKMDKTEYNEKEVVSGLHFAAYAQERSLAYSNLFVEILLNQPQDRGVSLQEC